MGEPLGARIVRELREAVEGELRRLAPDVHEDMLWTIGVPVQYIGRRTIRSLPGEPPRRETGALQDSWNWRVLTPAVDRTVAEIYTASKVGLYLQRGTSRIRPRPHLDPVFVKWIDPAFKRIVQAVR